MAAVTPVKYIWMDGSLVEWENATVHVLTHALHYGTAVFEGMRAYETADGRAGVFRLQEHMERFVRSGRMLRMECPFTVDELCDAVKETIRENELSSCYIRPLMWRGYGAMGVDPLQAPINVMIAVWSWDSYLGEDAVNNGAKVGVSSWRQRGVNATPPAIKASGNYLNSGLARIEANDHGYVEAILLNEQGMVTEGTGENLFVVRGGIVSTPPISDGVLEGITRDTIMTLAIENDIPVLEESLVRTDLYVADEMFMTGSAAELVPVASVDGREIGKPGEITRLLQEQYSKVVRRELPGFEDWVELV